jgi:hypothetical protein
MGSDPGPPDLDPHDWYLDDNYTLVTPTELAKRVGYFVLVAFSYIAHK